MTSTCPLAVKDVPPFTSGIRSFFLIFSPLYRVARVSDRQYRGQKIDRQCRANIRKIKIALWVSCEQFQANFSALREVHPNPNPKRSRRGIPNCKRPNPKPNPNLRGIESDCQQQMKINIFKMDTKFSTRQPKYITVSTIQFFPRTSPVTGQVMVGIANCLTASSRMTCPVLCHKERYNRQK